MGFYIEYFCDNPDCQRAGNYEGPQGNTKKQVMEGLCKAGWKRVPHRGWLCPGCANIPAQEGE